MAAALFAESDGRRDRRFSLGNFRRRGADFSSWADCQSGGDVASTHRWNLVFSANGTNVRGRNLNPDRINKMNKTNSEDSVETDVVIPAGSGRSARSTTI